MPETNRGSNGDPDRPDRLAPGSIPHWLRKIARRQDGLQNIRRSPRRYRQARQMRRHSAQRQVEASRRCQQIAGGPA